MTSTPSQRYHLRPAAAFARASGALRGHAAAAAGVSLEALTLEQQEELVRLAGEAHLEGLFRFKRSGQLPRVGKVLGMLRGIHPSNLLDVGSGRGAFLWPLIQAFPQLAVTAVDLEPRRLREARQVAAGGARMVGLVADACALPFPDDAFDVVTALEVLEHLERPALATAEAARVARRFVIFSVPSRPDDNPEHLHLLDRETITALMQEAGAASVQVEAVHNHLVGLARLEAG